MPIDFRSSRQTYRAAPRRALHPAFRAVVRLRAGNLTRLSLIAGFSQKQELYQILRAERVAATPLTITRLERVADAIGFPRATIFLNDAVSA